ncbi:MAG: hypothetical protein JWP81_3854 [Ferruginibacter sp.]|nr:hypothetical protein [Ferruginibacter sp.]
MHKRNDELVLARPADTIQNQILFNSVLISRSFWLPAPVSTGAFILQRHDVFFSACCHNPSYSRWVLFQFLMCCAVYSGVPTGALIGALFFAPLQG